jgi:hypothetical protein
VSGIIHKIHKLDAWWPGHAKLIGMKGGGEQISFDAVIKRIAPEVPRFVVYPGKAWD